MRELPASGSPLRFGLRLTCALLLSLGGCSSGGGGDGGVSADAASLSLEGTIRVAFATAADSDTNDPDAPSAANDAPETAQPLQAPVTVGGYVNQPGAGAPGRSRVAGDLADCYRVALVAGQGARLAIAGDGLVDDLDLALFDSDGNEVAASDGVTPTESVAAPASGEYVLEVSPFSGASNYVLTIEPAAAAVAGAEAPEFVPGQVIVRFREPERAAAAAPGPEERARSVGMSLVARAGPHELLLAGGNGDELEAALRREGVRRPDSAARAPRARAAGGPEEEARHRRGATRRLAKALRRRVDVASADLNYVRRAAAEPADEHYPLQWHYPLIGLPGAWDHVQPDSGIVVAVVDTGVVAEHPDLAGQLVDGYDFIADPQRARDGDGCDPDPDDPGDGTTAGTSSFHGTHVAGTVAARTSLQPGGDAVGVAGVAWNAKVMPLRVLGVGGGTDFDVMQALRYAAGLDNACGVLPGSPADVVNLSLSGPGFSASFEALVGELRQAGLVVVAAAGNSASDAPRYPAGFDGVIGVSAVAADEDLAPYSSFGPSVDVAAPGGNLAEDRNGDGFGDGVLSTIYDETGGGSYGYGFLHGTSMAAPHVAGVVALMLGANPDLSPFDIDALLAAGALTRDLGSSRYFGAGLIDAFAAVGAAIEARGGAPPANAPRLRAEPGAFDLGSLAVRAELELRNAGGGDPPLVVEGATAETDDGGAWLAVEAVSTDANGLGRYALTVDRGGLADGVYTGAARFASSAGDLEVPVVVRVGASGEPSADAGRHFVLLVHGGTLATVKALSLDASGGAYRYRFDDVEPGEYLIYAGTDSDNDRRICDPGEACGAYATVDEPIRLQVDGNRSGLDFLTGFASPLASDAAGTEGGGRSRDPGPALAR